jgi:uncharacterized damage-inducible protein DinB
MTTDTTDPGPADAGLADVLQLERELQTPECRRDRVRVQALLAEDFTEVGASGRVWGRAATLELLGTEAADDTPIEVRDLAGRIIADGLVLARWDSVRGGRRARRTSLWRREAAGWRLVHHQGTLLPPLDSPPMTDPDKQDPDPRNPDEPDLDEQGRPEPPLAGDEAATLLGFLDYQRATLAWKCAGLDAAGLAATVAPSPMTLGGILKHLAYVEADWFARWLLGRDRPPPWDAVDWAADPDWDWHSAADDTPEQLRALWQDTVASSRALVAAALADGGLGQLARRAWPDGRAPSLRWILTHMIEEYARHNGHADLLRESVDGLTGE